MDLEILTLTEISWSYKGKYPYFLSYVESRGKKAHERQISKCFYGAVSLAKGLCTSLSSSNLHTFPECSLYTSH
jgi:hypothetical protein